jgi:hypothetical protein
MLAPGREPVGLARHYWYDVLDLKGAYDLIHARRLIESRPFLSRIPDQSLIVPQYFPETDHVAATRGNGYAFVYFPTGKSAEIRMGKLDAEIILAYWFDPRKGDAIFIDKYSGKSNMRFTPPSTGRGNDWILVLDDESKNFKSPGK